jgi:hypothetical protein
MPQSSLLWLAIFMGQGSKAKYTVVLVLRTMPGVYTIKIAIRFLALRSEASPA